MSSKERFSLRDPKVYYQHLYVSIIKAIVAGVGTTAISMVLFAKILVAAKLPLYSVVPLSTMAAALGVFVSVLFLAPNINLYGIVTGLLFALVIFAILTGIGVFFYSASPSINSAVRAVVLLIAGCLGGVLSRNRKKSKISRR